MFTGIIIGTGRISELKAVDLGLRVAIEFDGHSSKISDWKLGESIAVNGVCLTLENPLPVNGSALWFCVSPETLSKTDFQKLKIGHRVNLERAMTLETRLSGHLVQGHVDGVAEVLSKERQGEFWKIQVRIPSSYERYLVGKGSITFDGISLTINELRSDGVGAAVDLMIIPHTYEVTNISQWLSEKSTVNFEVDVIAKHLERLCIPYQK